MEYNSIATFLLLGYTSSFASKGLEEIRVGLAVLGGDFYSMFDTCMAELKACLLSSGSHYLSQWIGLR